MEGRIQEEDWAILWLPAWELTWEDKGNGDWIKGFVKKHTRFYCNCLNTLWNWCHLKDMEIQRSTHRRHAAHKSSCLSHDWYQHFLSEAVKPIKVPYSKLGVIFNGRQKFLRTPVRASDG